jgi:hypothetical protein
MKTFLVLYGADGSFATFDERAAADIYAKKMVTEQGTPAYVYSILVTYKQEITCTEHLPPSPPTLYRGK